MKTSRLGRILIYTVAVGLLLLLIAAVAAWYVTGRSFDECFFGVCCGAMYLTGKAMGLTYKEICVIGNIYVEAIVCLLTALWVTWICIRNFCRRRTLGRGLLMVGGVAYGLVFVGGFVWICRHYAMPLDDAFDLCRSELVVLAAKYHTTYNMVNYVIFIGMFLVCIIWNIILAAVIGRRYERKLCIFAAEVEING